MQKVTTGTTGAIFQKNNVKLYVSAVTLSTTDNIRFLKTKNQSIKGTIS